MIKNKKQAKKCRDFEQKKLFNINHKTNFCYSTANCFTIHQIKSDNRLIKFMCYFITILK